VIYRRYCSDYPHIGKKLYDGCINKPVDDGHRLKGEEIMKKKII